ncbi:MAG: OprD family outer membrane porin [Campylobacteraceae bacterium]
MFKKKITCISLAVVACSCIYANDSLIEALKNGKTSGHFKFVYTSGSNSDAPNQAGPANDSNTGAVALELKYLSDKFYGFSFGAGFQAGHDLEFHDYDGSSDDDARNTVSTTLLSELYIQYSFLNSDIKVGRQKIKLPLIMTDTAFALEDSFDAASLTINEIPDTSINLLYVKEWKMLYGNDALSTDPTQQDMHYKDGLYSFYIKNKSVKNLTLDGQFITTNEDKRTWDPPAIIDTKGYSEYFVQANYKLPIDIPLSVSVLYAGASYDNKTLKDASMYGIKVDTSISDVKLGVAFTKVDDDANFPGTLGHVPDTIAYTDMLNNMAIFAGVTAYSVEARYRFSFGLDAALKYGYFEQSEKGYINSGTTGIKATSGTIGNRINLDKSHELNLDLDYAFSGALKGLSTKLRTGYNKYDVSGEDDFLYARLHIIYSF